MGVSGFISAASALKGARDSSRARSDAKKAIKKAEDDQAEQERILAESTPSSTMGAKKRVGVEREQLRRSKGGRRGNVLKSDSLG